MIINNTMEFYERLDQAKKMLKLTNEDLGNIIGKNPDTFRMATVKKSLKPYEINTIEIYLDKLENKQETKTPDTNQGFYLKEEYDKLIRRYELLLDRLEKELDFERSKNNKI